MRRPLSAAALFSLLALVFVAPAGASSSMALGMDDDGLLQRVSSTTIPTAAQWQANGIHQSRLMLNWSRIAPESMSTRKPSGFDARNPNSRGYYWNDVDRAVSALASHGIAVTLMLSTPMPLWASQVPSRRSTTYKPDPKAFGDFAHAVAERYAGRIESYILINEPNLWQYITPQWSCTSSSARSCTPASPAIYRALYRRGYSEVKAVDPKAAVWIGALAPHGRAGVSPTASSLGPLAFFKGVGCVTASYAKDRSSPGCRGFQPVTTEGIAHHPHTILGSPTQPDPMPDSVNIATISRLTTVFDRMQAKGGILNGNAAGADQARKPLNIFIDEYGIQTNPPDKLQGLPPATQDVYYQQVAYMMWKNPRVAQLGLYLWKDEPQTAKKSWAWQSGMYFASGKPKPSALSFQHPFWVDLPKNSQTATVWGQLRATPGAVATVQVQPSGSSKFVDLKSVTTNAQGFFAFTAKVSRKTAFRFRYGTPVKTSETRTVAPHRK